MIKRFHPGFFPAQKKGFAFIPCPNIWIGNKNETLNNIGLADLCPPAGRVMIAVFIVTEATFYEGHTPRLYQLPSPLTYAENLVLEIDDVGFGFITEPM